MPDGLGELARISVRIAALGPVGCGVLAGVGLAVIVAGHRAFRPAAALVASGGGALGAWLLIDLLQPKLPVSAPFAVATAAAALCALALAFPRLGLAVASSAFGLLAGLQVRGWLAAEHHPLAIVGGAVLGVFIAAVFSGTLPTFVPPIVGAVAIAAGAWGWMGSSGFSPQLFRLPAAWVAIAGVIAVAGVAVERARQARRESAPTRDAADSKRRREAEDRARHDRYMKM